MNAPAQGSNTVLLVDDDEMNLELLEQQLDEVDCVPVTSANGEMALEILAANAGEHGFPGIVLTDVSMPVLDGLDLLSRARRIDPELPVILLTAYGDVDSAVRAMKEGAFDFIERPYVPERLRLQVERALETRRIVLENRMLRAQIANRSGIASRLIGNSPPMRALREQIANVADTDVSVLIQGETGTGKELVARSLHEFSTRKAANFVALNCAAIPESMLEAELFGHEAGAYTGATRRRIGRIEYADAGTLFLDEVESMPTHHQVRLLRALQERSIERLGSNESVPVDFRLVAATKTDLAEAARNGEFREDLYFRINVAELHIPPLRERREDVPALLEQFTQELAARHDRDARPMEAAEMQSLFAYGWPGNVRELRNVAERRILGLGDMASMLGGDQAAAVALPDRVDAFERTLITQALIEHGGSIQTVADELGLPRRTL